MGAYAGPPVLAQLTPVLDTYSLLAQATNNRRFHHIQATCATHDVLLSLDGTNAHFCIPAGAALPPIPNLSFTAIYAKNRTAESAATNLAVSVW